MARGWASLALRAASFLAKRFNPDRASCAARSSGIISPVAPESWFDLPPFARISQKGREVHHACRPRGYGWTHVPSRYFGR